MHKTKKASMLLTLLLLLTAVNHPVQAQAPGGNHPGYIHALAYLRSARWLLSHQPGDGRVYEGESIALQQVNDAINDLNTASIVDGKDINDHPKVDVPDQGSRLIRAIESLHQARHEISGEEDDPTSRGLRHLCFDHIDQAIQAASHAHDAWVLDNKHS